MHCILFCFIPFVICCVHSLPIDTLLSFRNAIPDRKAILQRRQYGYENIAVSDECDWNEIQITEKSNNLISNWKQCNKTWGKHCHSILTDTNKNAKYIATLDACAPHLCSEQDVDLIVGRNIRKAGLKPSPFVDLTSNVYSVTYCDEEQPLLLGFWTTVSFCCLLVLLAMSGSFIHFYMSWKYNHGSAQDNMIDQIGWMTILCSSNTKKKEVTKKNNIPDIIITSPRKGKFSMSFADTLSDVESNGNEKESKEEVEVCLSPIPFPKLEPSKKKINSKRSVRSTSTQKESLRRACSFQEQLFSYDDLSYKTPSCTTDVFVSPIKSTSNDGTNLSRSPPNPPNLLVQMLAPMSIQKTVTKLRRGPLDEDYSSSARNFQFCYGLKTLALWGYLFSLTGLLFATSYSNGNQMDLHAIVQTRWFQVLFNVNQHLHSLFFFLGLHSLLTIRLSLEKIEQEDRQSLLTFAYLFVKRFVEVLPMYAITILLWINVVPSIATGPSWFAVRSNDNCYGLNWMNFLYQNNMYSLSETCMPWTWILACDMQLYTINLILFYIHMKFPKVGNLLRVVAFLFTATTSIFLSYKHRISNDITLDFLKNMPLNTTLNEYLNHFTGSSRTSFDVLMVKPYYQVQVYMIGTVFAQFLYNHKIIFNKWTVVTMGILTMLTLPILAAISFGFTKVPEMWQFLCVSVADKIWVIPIVPFVLFLRYSRINNIITSFLSGSFWKYLSSMYPCILISQPAITIIVLYSMNYTIPFTWFTVVSVFLTSLHLSYIYSLLMILFVQNPIHHFSGVIVIMWKKGIGEHQIKNEFEYQHTRRGRNLDDRSRSWFRNWQERIRYSLSSIYSPYAVSSKYFPM